MRIFVAGVTGVIGRILLPILVGMGQFIILLEVSFWYNETH